MESQNDLKSGISSYRKERPESMFFEDSPKTSTAKKALSEMSSEIENFPNSMFFDNESENSYKTKTINKEEKNNFENEDQKSGISSYYNPESMFYLNSDASKISKSDFGKESSYTESEIFEEKKEDEEEEDQMVSISPKKKAKSTQSIQKLEHIRKYNTQQSVNEKQKKKEKKNYEKTMEEVEEMASKEEVSSENINTDKDFYVEEKMLETNKNSRKKIKSLKIKTDLSNSKVSKAIKTKNERILDTFDLKADFSSYFPHNNSNSLFHNKN